MYQRSRRKLVVPFLVPAFLLYTFFGLIPLVQTAFRSLTNWHGHGEARLFSGLTNYRLLFMDPQFLNAAQNTAIFAVSGGIILFIPAMFISWALTQKIKMKATFRYIIIAPQVLSIVAVALLWKLLYNPVFGPINNLLKAVGLKSLALPWLGDSRTALLAIVVAAVWQQLGMWVLLISAGLERIPLELLEAARVDGATEWEVFWGITMPLMWGVLRLLLIVWIIESLQTFTLVYVMVTHGTGTTEVMTTLMYNRAFHSHQWGLACAIATLLLVATFSLSLFTNWVTKRETIQY